MTIKDFPKSRHVKLLIKSLKKQIVVVQYSREHLLDIFRLYSVSL